MYANDCSVCGEPLGRRVRQSEVLAQVPEEPDAYDDGHFGEIGRDAHAGLLLAVVETTFATLAWLSGGLGSMKIDTASKTTNMTPEIPSHRCLIAIV